MKHLLRQLNYSILIGMFATLPFILMEWSYSNGFPLGVPYSVFIFLWIMATIFSLLIFSLWRTPYKTPVKEWIVPLLLKVAVAIPVVFAWAGMVIDQLPCFLGGRGC